MHCNEKRDSLYHICILLMLTGHYPLTLCCVLWDSSSNKDRPCQIGEMLPLSNAAWNGCWEKQKLFAVGTSREKCSCEKWDKYEIIWGEEICYRLLCHREPKWLLSCWVSHQQTNCHFNSKEFEGKNAFCQRQYLDFFLICKSNSTLPKSQIQDNCLQFCKTCSFTVMFPWVSHETVRQ